MARTPTYPLGMPDDVRARFQAGADKHGVPLAEWIRDSCEMRLRDGNQPRSLGRELGGGRAKEFRGEDPKVRPRPRQS